MREREREREGEGMRNVLIPRGSEQTAKEWGWGGGLGGQRKDREKKLESQRDWKQAGNRTYNSAVLSGLLTQPLMASDPGKPPPHQGWGPISSSVKRGPKKLCKPPLLQKNFDHLQYARDRKSNRFVIDRQHAAILCNATAVSAAE